MILTEREKWLMQQAWKVSKDYDHELNTMDYWLSEDTGCNGADVEMLLAHDAPTSESIIKKIDADNLPAGEVWAWCDAGLFFGEIYMNRVFNQLRVDSKYRNFRNPTHYIEQEDLIKLFEDSK